MKSVLEMVQEAIEKGEFESLLKGDKSYALPRPYMCPTEIPTDWDRILTEGVYELFKVNPSSVNEKVLEDALINLMVDVEGIYSALNILFRQLMHEEYFRSSRLSPFVMGKDKIIKTLSAKLLGHKIEFLKDFRWMGSIEKDGLWGEVRRICIIIQKNYGIKILDQRNYKR